MISLPTFLSFKRQKEIHHSQNGQALLIVLLVMAVALTVVLSTASRSVTDVQTTSLEEDSLRAFSAAEAGVEEALLENTSISTQNLSNNAQYAVDYDGSTGSNIFNFPNEYLSGDTATVWLVRLDENGNLYCGTDPDQRCARGTRMRLCWGSPGTLGNGNSEAPALEVSVFYDDTLQAISPGQDFSNVQVKRITLDSNSFRTSSNSFNSAINNCTLSGESYAFNSDNILFGSVGSGIPLGLPQSTCVNQEGCLLMARVRFLYNQTQSSSLGMRLYATGGTQLPPQGATISSTGNAGDSTRKIEVYQGFSEVPSIFESAVFSDQPIIK